MEREKGQAEVLSQPTLYAVSGRPASFDVGGEFPVPTKSSGNVTIEFKRYGTQIDVVPHLLDKAIRLDFRVRVSELDSANGIKVDRVAIPALHVLCDMETGIELKHGQVLLLRLSSREIVRDSRSSEKGHDRTPGVAAKETCEDVETSIAVRPQLTE
jgi:pilus assembly protein CpaC